METIDVQKDVTVFNFQDAHEVRTIIRDGEPWFVAKDICDILEIVNVSDALSALDSDEKMTIANTDSHSSERGGAKSYLVVNESGLYALVFKSRKPQAQTFRKWVTSEVLPAIRKTGQYRLEHVAPSVYDTAASTFSGYTRVAKMFGLEGNAALISANVATRKVTGIDFQHDLQIELKTPDQQYLLTPTQIAERLHLSGPREANRLLAAKGLQTKESGQWVPTDKGKAFSTLLDTGEKHTNGCMVQQLKWKESVLKEFELL